MPPGQPRRFAALWRGINVGKAKRIAMADLRAVLGGLGFKDVKTLLNSGNAVFTVPGNDTSDVSTLEAAVQNAIARKAGFTSRVMLVSPAELDEVLASNPFPHAISQPPRFLIAILAPDVDRKQLAALSAQAAAAGEFSAGKRAAYMWCPDGIASSPWPLAIDRALKDGVTSRNWATLQKLRALL